MYKSVTAKLIGASVAGVVFGFGLVSRAQINVNGSYASDYGSPIVLQTINTGFGDSTVGDGTSTGGSELDAAYGVAENGNLYLFLPGNFEDNGNHANVFIQSTGGGQNVLNVSNGWTGSAMNGSVFSPGFAPNLFLDANDYQGTLYVDEYLLNGGGSTNYYLGSVALINGIGNGSLPDDISGNILVGLNDTNISQMGASGAPANPAYVGSVATGLEIAIPLADIGNPSSVEVMADINGGGDGYLSNQFLPGLPVGTQNLGGGGPYTGPSSGTFNFANVPGEFFTVMVPEPASISLVAAATMMLSIRRRKARI